MSTPAGSGEEARLAALRSYKILDTEPEKAFDDLTLLASYICQTPIALVSLVDADRQWFKSKVGLTVSETARDISFCTHVIEQPDLLIVPDALEDERFAHSPLVTSEPKIRFYAGAPLFTADGHHALGTLCVVDRVPRELTQEQKQALEALSRQVQAQMELRRNLMELKEALSQRDKVEEALKNGLQQLARIDPLTGAGNRHSFYELAAIERNKAQRSGRPITVAYLDVDNLKEVNDKLGQPIGDTVLVTVAMLLQDGIRGTDVTARLGGDEFAILMPESPADAAQVMMVRVQKLLLEAMQKNDWPVTFSIGMVTFNKVPASPEEMIHKADQLMYAVKTGGKNALKAEVVEG